MSKKFSLTLDFEIDRSSKGGEQENLPATDMKLNYANTIEVAGNSRK